jgi:hypothetical protein
VPLDDDARDGRLDGLRPLVGREGVDLARAGHGLAPGRERSEQQEGREGHGEPLGGPERHGGRGHQARGGEQRGGFGVAVRRDGV